MPATNAPPLAMTMKRVVYLASPKSPTEINGVEEVYVENLSIPKCQKCGDGDLVPLSDFGSQGAPIHFKAWVCTKPECGFNLKIRNGDVYIDEPIVSGVAHTPRVR